MYYTLYMNKIIDIKYVLIIKVSSLFINVNKSNFKM